MRPTRLEIVKIRLDGGTQVRAAIDEDLVGYYADLLADGTKFDAIEVLHDGSDYWPWDGFHRIHAHRKAGAAHVMAIVRPGTRKDAVRRALSANLKHGKPMNTADKVHAVEIALKEFTELSDRQIATEVGVNNHTVGKYRSQMEATGQIAQLDRREGSDGKSRPVHKSKTQEPGAAINPDDIPFDMSLKSDSAPAPAEQKHEQSDDGDTAADTRPADQDFVGNVIDGPIAEDFARRVEINRLARTLSGVKTTVLKAVEADDRLYRDLLATAFQAEITMLYRRLTMLRPYALCVYCSGDGCKACHGRGWLCESAYEVAPPEMKRAQHAS